jgi:hypothetical protein
LLLLLLLLFVVVVFDVDDDDICDDVGAEEGDICIEEGVVSGEGGVGLEISYGDCLGGGDDCEGFITQEDCEDNDCIWEEDSDICHEDDSGPPECVMDCGGCIDEDCEEDEFCEWLVTLPGDACLDDCDQEVLEEIDEMIGECGDEQEVTLSFGSVDEGAGTMEILMDNSEDVYGFQFDLTGIVITGVSGGSAGDAGFMVSASESRVIGFSLTGDFIPAGSGVLTYLTYITFSLFKC